MRLLCSSAGLRVRVCQRPNRDLGYARKRCVYVRCVCIATGGSRTHKTRESHQVPGLERLPVSPRSRPELGDGWIATPSPQIAPRNPIGLRGPWGALFQTARHTLGASPPVGQAILSLYTWSNDHASETEIQTITGADSQAPQAHRSVGPRGEEGAHEEAASQDLLIPTSKTGPWSRGARAYGAFPPVQGPADHGLIHPVLGTQMQNPPHTERRVGHQGLQ